MATIEALTPEEYDTLVALTEKAKRLARERMAAYIKATGGYGPGRYDLFDKIEFNARGDRLGRHPLGRYDIALTYRDHERDTVEVHLPSAILWDPDGITAAVVAEQDAIRLAYEAADAERTAEIRAEAERTELARAKATLRKHGFKAVKS